MTAGPEVTGPEQVEVLAQHEGVRIERITSRGHASAPGFWYDQDEHEWVTLISGAARLELCDPDEQLKLRPGDHLLIPAHRRHRVAWTMPEGETVWLAVFFGPAAADGEAGQEAGAA